MQPTSFLKESHFISFATDVSNNYNTFCIKENKISTIVCYTAKPKILSWKILQVANALDFLARRKYVHRDIAARNCLGESWINISSLSPSFSGTYSIPLSHAVGQQLEIKIADFGLARGVLEKCYYKVVGNTVLPIRSMAPESLLYGIFTTASDVW